MSRIQQDFRYALRIMRKKPGFSIFAVLTLALGIGVNTVVFSVTNAILLRPLQVREPDRLIRIYQKTAEGNLQQRFSYPDYIDLRDRTTSLEGLVAVALMPFRFETTESQQQILGEAVSADYFGVLGLNPLHGRLISRTDVAASRPVVVLSRRFVERNFENSTILGQPVRLNGQVHDIIGILDSDFTGTFAGARIDAWIPLQRSGSMMGRDWDRDRAKPSVHVLGRLKPEVSSAQAQAELSAVYRNLEKQYRVIRGKTIVTAPATLLHGKLRRGASIFFMAVMVLMGLVLFIACSNLAGLLLARALQRRREIAIRMSLGAHRKQIAMQFFSETLLIAVLGGIAGFLLALWLGNLVVSFWPIPTVPIHFDFSPDARVFFFSSGISLLSGLLLGLAPVMHSKKQDFITALKQKEDGTLGGLRLRNALLVLQIAMSMLLVICAALFVQSWRNAEQLDPGFTAENVLAMDINVADRGLSQTEGELFFRQLLERVRPLPGVVDVAYSDLAPLDLATGRTRAKVVGYDPPAGQEALSISWSKVSVDFFRTMQIPFVAGSGFTAQLDAEVPPVAVINQTMANHFWQGEDAIGKSFEVEDGTFKTVRVIGVVADAKYRTPAEEPTPHFYVSHQQFYDPGMTLLVRTNANPKTFTHLIEQQITAVHPDIQAFFARSMQEHLAFSYLPAKIGGSLLGFLGLLALFLACIGIYAAIAFQVTQRRKEIGIRVAIGAKPAAILGLFVQLGLKLGVIGCGLGIAASFLMTQLLSNLLVGVETHDPKTFVFVPSLLILLTLIACALPAYRASRIDPLQSLRYE